VLEGGVGALLDCDFFAFGPYFSSRGWNRGFARVALSLFFSSHLMVFLSSLV
jgi:hypothetical protein